MTREELARYDGREGRKAYAAVNGTIYDFTASELWYGGGHQGQHQAGCDLTEELKRAPHVRAVVERFPVVGQLEGEQPHRGGGRGKWLAVVALIAALVIAFLLLR